MSPDLEDVRAALATVLDPELRRPITELGMVDAVSVADGVVDVGILLTISGCPLRDTITRDVSAAVRAVPGVVDVRVTMATMSDEQRAALRSTLGTGPSPAIPFALPNSRTRVYAVASGKGGVGKSTVAVNLAAAWAADGLEVGILDADIYGFSVPRMMGVETRPTMVADLLIPPVAHGVKVISAGMFVEHNAPIAWRGPLLHRALQQLLADVFWGTLDVLLLDLPPGTGDVALSVAQLLPHTEFLVVTTPQSAAAEVAERAGAVAVQTRQRIVGVIENMTSLRMPDGREWNLFGSGGGEAVAQSLSRIADATVPLLGQIPLDPLLPPTGDDGVPLVVSAPESPTGQALRTLAAAVTARSRSLAGRRLDITAVAR